MTSFDRRLIPVRPDVAAVQYQDDHLSERYAVGELRQVAYGHCNLHETPCADVGLDTQLHCGETFMVYDEKDGWAWGQVTRDGYVGYVRSEGLRRQVEQTTHRVKVLRSFVYPEPNMKRTPISCLSLNAEVNVDGDEAGFAKTTQGFVWAAHLGDKEEGSGSVVENAQRFVGVPYLWGGRTSLGIDCSGLIQEAFLAAGQTVQRDSDMQEQSIGTQINLDNSIDGLKSGDLVFWDRHVGIMTDPETVLHANAYHMSVASEPLAQAVARIATVEGPITSIRRVVD